MISNLGRYTIWCFEFLFRLRVSDFPQAFIHIHEFPWIHSSHSMEATIIRHQMKLQCQPLYFLLGFAASFWASAFSVLLASTFVHTLCAFLFLLMNGVGSGWEGGGGGADEDEEEYLEEGRKVGPKMLLRVPATLAGVLAPICWRSCARNAEAPDFAFGFGVTNWKVACFFWLILSQALRGGQRKDAGTLFGIGGLRSYTHSQKPNQMIACVHPFRNHRGT